MIKLDIKPLSVNEAYSGRRCKTKKYSSYKRYLMMILPSVNVPDGNLKISIKWGFSSHGSDIDNPCKPFIDCLQAKYGFNDNRVSVLNLRREQVKKGGEFVEFKIESFNQ